ncbi:MAG: DUF4836 family protein, partial [Verrucomicrobiota bacterium]|nr:DUF4836 family protein [Verrucomicrobiota bacterium]
MKFWLFRNDNTEGPFSIDELQNRLQDGELSPDDKICPMGESDWQPLSTIAAPPPPPEGGLTPPPPPTGDEAAPSLGDELPATPAGDVLPPPPSALPATPAGRRRNLTLALVAAAVVVTGIAATLIYLLNDPSRPLPKTANYVPKDSSLVMTTHVGDLLEKGNISDLLGKGIMQDFPIPRPIRKKIEDFFENPAEFGLNTKEPVYVFMIPGPGKGNYPAFGITIPVIGRDEFLEGLEDIVTIEKRPDEMLMALIDDLKKNDTVSPENEVAFGINDEVFVIIIQDIPYSERRNRKEGALAKVAEEVLKGGEGLVAANKSFHEHQTTLFDVGTWINLGSLIEMMPAEELEREFGQLGDLKKLKSFQLTGSIHFGQGEVTGDMAMYYDEKLLGDWGGGGLGSELLDAVPEGTMMAISQSMDMEVVKKWFDDRPGIKKDIEEALQEGIGMSLDEALGAFGGDLVLALTDLEMVRTQWGGSMPQPAILFGATIKDKKKVEKMLAEPMRELERDEDAPVRLVMRDNAFFLCSPEDERDLEKNGAVDDPIAGEKRSLLASNDTGFFLDYKEMERVISKVGGDDEEVEILLDALDGLGLATLTWNAEAGAQKIQARIKMPKEDENSLKQIIDSAFSAAINVNKRMRRGRGWDGPDVPDQVTAEEAWPNDAKEMESVEEKAQAWPNDAKEIEPEWEKATEPTKPRFNEPNPNFGDPSGSGGSGGDPDASDPTGPGGFDGPRFNPNFGEKKSKPRFNPNFGEKKSKGGFAPPSNTPIPRFDRNKSSSKGGFPKATDEATGFATKTAKSSQPDSHGHDAHAGPWLTSLPTALAQARRQGKLVLIDFTGSDWCPPCMMLHDKVLTQKPFLDYARQNLVLVMLDFPRGKNQTVRLANTNQNLAKKYNVSGFPTVILLDGNGKELAREVGL